MFIIEVLLSSMVDLVGQLIQLKHERQVRQSPHLHLRSFCRITATHKYTSFNGLFSRTSQHQQGSTNLDFSQARDDAAVASAEPYANHLNLDPNM